MAEKGNKSADVYGEQTVEEAFGATLKSNFAFMQQWEPVAQKGEDIEGVHQVRVAYRRLRSALVIYRKAMPRILTDSWGEEMRWAASELGPARDLDVFISEGLAPMAGKIPLPEGENKLLELAKEHRAQAYTRVQEMIQSQRYQNFKSGFSAWVAQKGWRGGEISQEVLSGFEKGVVRYAMKTLDKRVSSVLLTGQDMGRMSAEELHQLRIECKKLRYATEFFNSLFPAEEMAGFTLQLKGLQGLLGIMNDVAVLPGLLDTLLEGVQDKETLKYAGALIGWRLRQYEEVRGQLDGRWEAFAQQKLPWKGAKK
ncbi:MAG: CHAD domain-containing protein [Magnetococcus sp. DMHC-6]